MLPGYCETMTDHQNPPLNPRDLALLWVLATGASPEEAAASLRDHGLVTDADHMAETAALGPAVGSRSWSFDRASNISVSRSNPAVKSSRLDENAIRIWCSPPGPYSFPARTATPYSRAVAAMEAAVRPRFDLIHT